ncbi:MAG: 50S ribosomal protein L10 [archaeon]
MAHVSEDKKKVVKELVTLINSNPIIGTVDMTNIPAKQLQKIRIQIRGVAQLRMAKRRLMKIAFKESNKKELTKLEPYLEGMPALIFSKENPFKLYSLLDKNKSSAPAKGGQKAPKPIWVKAGSTSFTPGPIIGQLGKYKIKTGVEKGKIAIKEDQMVAKEGDVISEDLASILTRLGIEPMEIGVSPVAVYEGGQIYERSILRIDKAEFEQKVKLAAIEAFNVAIFSAYMSKDTINTLLGKAYKDSSAVAMDAKFITNDNLKDFFAQAMADAAAVFAQMSPGVEEPTHHEHKESKKEEPKEDAAAGLGSLFG